MASTGSIQFRVFTSNANIPIEGATIVLQQQDAPHELLGVLVTDESGQTDPLVLPARDVALGQQPENEIEPWIGLKAYIDHPEFERVILNGIQLFPGVLTVQNVQMIPINQIEPEAGEYQEFDFTPQPIWEGDSNDR